MEKAMSTGMTAMPVATAAATMKSGIGLSPVVDLPAEYHAAIGAIAAKWNWLENQLGVLIREGFGLDKKEGRVLTVGMAMKPKCSILRIMAVKWVKDAELQRDLKNLATDCLKHIDKRNDHVHGLWVHPIGEPSNIGLAVMKEGEQRYMPHFKPVTSADLRGIVRSFEQLQQRAQAVTDRIKGRLR